MKKWLGGCGSCGALALAAAAMIAVIFIAVIIGITQVYTAAIYYWWNYGEGEGGEVTVPTSIHGAPASGTITATFHDPDYLAMFGVEHEGIDIANAVGTPIYCTSNEARVVSGGYDPGGYGVFLKIQDTASGWYILYAHLSSVSVGSGAVLHHGDVIGLMGSTGNSTGPHLHYEIRNNSNVRVDPQGSLGCC